MVGLPGLEPGTCGLKARCSALLSYKPLYQARPGILPRLATDAHLACALGIKCIRARHDSTSLCWPYASKTEPAAVACRMTLVSTAGLEPASSGFGIPGLVRWATWRLNMEIGRLEPEAGIEPATSSLPRRRSATELQGRAEEAVAPERHAPVPRDHGGVPAIFH